MRVRHVVLLLCDACSILSLFFRLIPLFHYISLPLLFHGDKRDRRKILTQCAQWSQYYEPNIISYRFFKMAAIESEIYFQVQV